MASKKKHSFSIFFTKILWIIFLVFHESNLVICNELDDDNLEKALEAIERRQKDLELQENEYYGQPENIGYGFQKTLGFFDNGPAAEIGTFNSEPKNENEFQNIFYNYQKGDENNRKSNFRERMSNYRKNHLVSDRIDGEDYIPSSIEYLQMLKNLWSKYRQSRNEDIDIDNLTDEQLGEILNSLYSRESSDEKFANDYDKNFKPKTFKQLESIPLRSRKNYRVFESLSERNKRYPYFGDDVYNKKPIHSQNLNYENVPRNDYPYSMKYLYPDANKETVDNLREGFDLIGDDKDSDVFRILNNAMNHPKYFEEEGPYWSEEQNSYDDGVWLPGPVVSDDWYDNSERNEKRSEMTTRYFKPHNGIRFNSKRFPVKRSSIRVRKEVKNEKVSKELKGIFGTSAPTTVPPKKGAEKKPTGISKKQNRTTSAPAKHFESKKVVRSADQYQKERVLPFQQNQEIADLFSIEKKSANKKSIDWSQYFGIDKRSQQNWLKNDYLRRAQSHLLVPKTKRLSMDRVNVGTNLLDSYQPQYQMPFDTRRFNKKGQSNDIGSNIDKVENKISDIEEKLINDALKYTGAHSEVRGAELNKVKNRVIQHLEAAYSLEKMKNALEEFKNLIKPEKEQLSIESPKKTITEAPKVEPQTTASTLKENPNVEKPIADKKLNSENSKILATKKEGIKDIFNRELSENLEFLNKQPYYNKMYDNEECPVLDQVLQNCQRIEGIGGKFSDLLVPLCSLQQICYFCGSEIGFTKMSMCDSMYLTEVQNVCQDNNDCMISARDSLMALRDIYEQSFTKSNGRFLFGTCLSNPCIQRYFLNSPGAIYSFEV